MNVKRLLSKDYQFELALIFGGLATLIIALFSRDDHGMWPFWVGIGGGVSAGLFKNSISTIVNLGLGLSLIPSLYLGFTSDIILGVQALMSTWIGTMFGSGAGHLIALTYSSLFPTKKE